MRIRGLVGAFNSVRTQLQVGLTPDDVAPFGQQVETTLRAVEAICARHNVSVERLPAPSRRAYFFLRKLDLTTLPIRTGVPTGDPAVRVRGLLKVREYLTHRLWQRLDALLMAPEPREDLLEKFVEASSDIEKICARRGKTPAALDDRARRIYCWLKFLSDPEKLAAHLAALARARDAARALPHPSPSHSLRVHLVNQEALWRRRDSVSTSLLRVHVGFQSAPPRVWRSLLESALRPRSPDSKSVFSAFSETEEFGAVLFEIEAFAMPPAPRTQGYIHDLKASFDRVNATYFGDTLPQPTLAWNRTLAVRKLAHYQPSRDTVVVSVALDDPSVSETVVDFVMHHELLHKKHGSKMVGGRRVVHSPEFRADERRFQGYEDVERQLRLITTRQHPTINEGGADEGGE